MEPARIILAILLPPLIVYLEKGLTAQFFVNVLLTVLCFFPGILHALILLLMKKAD